MSEIKVELTYTPAECSAVFLAVKDACWRDERVDKVEETETFPQAASPFGSKSLWSHGASGLQHSQQQPVW